MRLADAPCWHAHEHEAAALGAWPPWSAGTEARSSAGRSSPALMAPLRRRASVSAPVTGLWLSLWLIHPRPEPFTGVHRLPARAGHGRWRTVVNAGAQYSKACEGATPPWVQIPPPPPLTCDDASPDGMLDRGGHGGGLIFRPQLVSVERAQVPLPPWMGHQFSPCTAVGVISDEALPAPYRCRQEPLPDIVAGLVVVPSSGVCCAPDLPVEPTYTPVKRARYCSGLAVAGPRPPGYPPTFRPQ
jgi:hypothetical protein